MLEIRYIFPSQRLITLYGDNLGRVYFDLAADTEVRLTKLLSEVGELSEVVSQEAALAFSMPATGKNKALLEQFRPDAVNRTSGIINIEAVQNGEILPLTGMILESFDQGERSYEVEIFGQSYLDELDEISLANLDLGEFTYSKENVISNWGNRTAVVQAGFCDYGAFSSSPSVTLADFRLWYRITSLLEAAFCAVGWGFKSQHWTIGEGASLYAYFPNDGEFYYEGKKSPRWVSTTVDGPIDLIGGRTVNILSLIDVYDPNDYWDNPSWPDAYRYEAPEAGPSEIPLRIEFENFKVELPPSPEGKPAYYFDIQIQKGKRVGGAFYPLATIFYQTWIGSADQTKFLDISFTATDPSAKNGDEYQIRTNYRDLEQGGGSGTAYRILSSTGIYWQPDPTVLYENDTIVLSNLLPNDITCLQLLKAAVHLCGGKLFTNYAERSVTLYTDRYYLQDEETIIEGFFQEGAPIDLRDSTITSLTSWSDEQKNKPRYRVYKFKDSTDPYITESEGEEDKFNRRVDLGYGLDEEKVIENELFEPTDEIFVGPETVGGNGVYLPVLYDNLDGELSTKLGARVCHFYGLIPQENGSRSWNFDGTDGEVLIPYLAQIPTVSLAPSDVDFIPLTFSGFARDLYSLYYRKICRRGLLYKLIISGGDPLYQAIDFRKKILVQDEDSALQMQPVGVRDHLAGTDSKTSLLVEAYIV